jgi:hypothetical protein
VLKGTLNENPGVKVGRNSLEMLSRYDKIGVPFGMMLSHPTEEKVA